MKEQFIYVSIDPYNNRSYAFESGQLKKFQFKRAKKNYYISFLKSQDFITTQIKISKQVPEEDLREAIEIKTYEELDLDHTIEYKIEYEEIPSLPNDKERIFNVFVTEKEILESIFEPIIANTGYLDFITASPLLFKSLYTRQILSPTTTDIFIYFDKDDAFLVIYKNGRFLYVKSLKYSFSYIAERLSEIKKSDVPVEEVMRDLSQEGLRISDLEKLQHYMQIFSELFLHINDILIYAKRANDIENIDTIYIGSSLGSIQGIEEYCQTYLAQPAFDFSFDYGIESNEPFVEDLHYLAILTAIDYNEKEEHYPNFSIYPRPLPFFKRPSGELTLVVAAGLIIGFSYPLYNFALGMKYQYEAKELQQLYPKIHAQKVALETKINQLKKKLKEVEQKEQSIQNEIANATNVLESIYKKKVDYKLKSVTLADLTQELIKYKLKVTSIDNNQTKYEFAVTSKDDKAITRFIEHIAKNRSDAYDIQTKDINKTGNIYMSTLEVEVK